jgi:hydrogenase-4 component E
VKGVTDLLLLTVLGLGLYVVAGHRIAACVRATALQGALLAVLPVALHGFREGEHLAYLLWVTLGTFVVKAVVIPLLLLRTMRQAHVRREVEPFVSLHVSLLIGAGLVGVSFWLAEALPFPGPIASTLLVPSAFAMLMLGFLVLVSRRKAVTQVVGYLVMENGVFIFGQTIAGQVPYVVELGILLDVLVGVFVMGIAIHHISREFDHIDTELLSTLKD